MGGQQFGEDTLHFDTRNLNGVLDFHPSQGLVRAQAGIQWPELRLGPAISSKGLTFVPICEEGAPEPDYLLLEDAIREKVASVMEVSEAGSIPVLEVENRQVKPILVLQGE